MTISRILLASIAVLGTAGCSTAAFREPVAQFGEQLTNLRVAADDWATQRTSARVVAVRTSRLRQRSELHLTAACAPATYHNNRPVCDLSATPTPSTRVTGTISAPVWQENPQACASEITPAGVNAARLRGLAGAAALAAAPQSAAPERLTPTTVLLSDYGRQLARLASADNAKAFDEAAAAMEAAIGRVGVLAGPYGAAAQAAAGSVLWLVGQGLEFHRRQTIISAVNAACPLVRVLVRTLPSQIAPDREQAMEALHSLAEEQLAFLNQRRIRHIGSDADYGSALDQTVRTIDALQALHALNPQALAQRILTAHDALVAAVNSNDVDIAELVAAIEAFGGHLQQVHTAFAALRGA